MNVDWDRICDFVFDTFGDDNAEMARYSLIEFGIDPDTRRPIVDEDYTPRIHVVSCGCVVCKSHRPPFIVSEVECEHEWDTDEMGEFCVRCYERKK